jgi:hypothetical protein
MVAAARTGHRVMSPEAIWVVVSFFSSFFCISKVTLMQSAYSREGSLCLTRRPFFEESKVLEAKDFRTLFLMLLDFDVLTRTHGKEKGKNCELRYGMLRHRQIPFCNLGDDAGGNGFLLLFFWVGVFEGSELSV